MIALINITIAKEGWHMYVEGHSTSFSDQSAKLVWVRVVKTPELEIRSLSLKPDLAMY